MTEKENTTGKQRIDWRHIRKVGIRTANELLEELGGGPDGLTRFVRSVTDFRSKAFGSIQMLDFEWSQTFAKSHQDKSRWKRLMRRIANVFDEIDRHRISRERIPRLFDQKVVARCMGIIRAFTEQAKQILTENRNQAQAA